VVIIIISCNAKNKYGRMYIVCTFVQSFALHFKRSKRLCLIHPFIVIYALTSSKKRNESVILSKGWKQFNDFAIDQKRVRLKKPSCETEKTLVTCRAKEKLEADLKPRYK